jgi:hypothetical protein
MFKRRGLANPVDYHKRGKDRRKLTNYLRTGRFKKIAGSSPIGGDVVSRRMSLFVFAGALFMIGFYYAIF